MSFLKRLLYYLFGFSIGLIFLFYFMGKKDATFNYSPNKRVLADIDKKIWILESSIDSLELVKGKLIRDFKVDFSRSDVELDSCKIYILESKFINEKTYYKVKNCSKSAKFEKYSF